MLGDLGGSKDLLRKSFPFCVVRKKKNKFFFFAHFLERANFVRLLAQKLSNIKISPEGLLLIFGEPTPDELELQVEGSWAVIVADMYRIRGIASVLYSNASFPLRG